MDRLQVYAEGTHLMLPWVERVMDYDVRAKPNMITSTSGSRDLQMVRVPIPHPLRPLRPFARAMPPPRRPGDNVAAAGCLVTEEQRGWL